MKKSIYLFAAALIAFAACSEKVDPIPEVEDLTLASEKIVDVDATSSIATVKFTAGKAWTATLSYPDGEEGGVALSKASGEAGDEELKLTFQTLSEELYGRIVDLAIKAGDATETVRFYQGIVFWSADEEPTFGVEGGNATVKIYTNTDVAIKKYDGADQAFPWAPITITEDEHTIDLAIKVDPNTDYDPRTAYVKFTVPAIQVPVLNEETGEPTGETEDAVYRLYIGQDGNIVFDWSVSLESGFNVTDIEGVHNSTASIALFDGKVLVSDATTVHAYNPANGSPVSFTLPDGLPVQSITNDDAGNLILADMITYLGVGKVYAIKAGDTKMANPVMLFQFVNDAWAGSLGADKVSVRGDVFGDAMVTMIYGGYPAYGGVSYGLNWAIKGGKADTYAYNEWNNSTNQATGGWFTVPSEAGNIWLSNRAVFAPAGPSLSDGFFYSGYDDLYNLYYYDGASWTAVVEGFGSWEYAPNAIATTEWNGKKVLSLVNMSYFPDWGIPSELYLIDVTNPKAPEVLSAAAYPVGETVISGGTESSTADVITTVDGNDLVAYVVETNNGVLAKVRYHKL